MRGEPGVPASGAGGTFRPAGGDVLSRARTGCSGHPLPGGQTGCAGRAGRSGVSRRGRDLLRRGQGAHMSRVRDGRQPAAMKKVRRHEACGRDVRGMAETYRSRTYRRRSSLPPVLKTGRHTGDDTPPHVSLSATKPDGKQACRAGRHPAGMTPSSCLRCLPPVRVRLSGTGTAAGRTFSRRHPVRPLPDGKKDLPSA